ncbi:MAG: hypothetical protein AAFV33_18980 [Chloroflexota bacterium]
MTEEVRKQLDVLLNNMSDEQQMQVFAFARSLMGSGQMHGQQVLFYICPDSFAIKEAPGTNEHGRPFVPCFAVQANEQFKPVMDENGRLQSRAPQWFLEAMRELYK